ncbi:MAG: SDR family oxidoreductase [Bacilli bacterium]|nr:SDR family oxidoreductase [Bacilli bacterium]
MHLSIKPETLKGKVVVITGAGGVICGAMAKAIAACGAKVAVLDRLLDKAEIVAKEITDNGGIAKGYMNNVLDREDLKKVHAEINADFGPVDILINGAGGNSPKATTTQEYYEEAKDEDTISFFDLKQEGVEFVFDLNFMGTFLPCQEFARDMLGRKGCSILNVSSMNAFTPLTKIPAYSAAKSSVSNFTKWLAVHFSKTGIRVNAIAPGFLVTAQNKALLFNADGTPTARTQKILAATPMDRFGEADELLAATLFLIDEGCSSFITGVVLPIDGGFSSYAGV